MRRRCCCRIVAEPCVAFADFLIHQINSNTFTFEDISIATRPIIIWAWDTSDGQSSIERNPTFTFPSAGGYWVHLVIQTDECGSEITKNFGISPCCAESVLASTIQIDAPEIGCSNCDQVEGVHILHYDSQVGITNSSSVYLSGPFCQGDYIFRWRMVRCANINFVTGDHLFLEARVAGGFGYDPVASWRLPRPIQPYNCEQEFFLTGGRTINNPGCNFGFGSTPLNDVLATPFIDLPI